MLDFSQNLFFVLPVLSHGRDVRKLRGFLGPNDFDCSVAKHVMASAEDRSEPFGAGNVPHMEE